MFGFLWIHGDSSLPQHRIAQSDAEAVRTDCVLTISFRNICASPPQATRKADALWVSMIQPEMVL